MKCESLKLYPVYLVGLVLMAAVTWLLVPFARGIHWVVGIVIAIVLCVGAVVCHVCSKRRTPWYIAGYALNAVASGLAIAVLYAELGWAADPRTLAVALIPAAALALILCLTRLLPSKLWRDVFIWTVLLLALAAIVLSIITWIKWERVLGSFCFFSSICLLFFLMACLLVDNGEKKWRYLSFSGFWAFAVIAVVVIVILSEGEILDGLDFDIGGTGGSGKKSKKVKPMK